MNNILEIDLSKKLEIKINNKSPVGLADLTLSLLAFNQQFHKFFESEVKDKNQLGSELYIKEVRSGSIVVELVTHALPILPLLWDQGGALFEWIKVSEDILLWLLGKIDTPPKELTKNDLKQWKSFVEPVAKDNGSQININLSDNNVVIKQLIINSIDANAIQNKISRLVGEMDSPEDNVHTKKVMYWYQAKFDPESETGNKAIIDDLTTKALKVVFENNGVKDAMLHVDPKFGKPWHELAYLVDVEVQTVKGDPKMYKVLKYYPEYTFDPRAE